MQALEVYQLLCRRVVIDFHLAPFVFDLAGLKLTRTAARALFEQLHDIHELKHPPHSHG